MMSILYSWATKEYLLWEMSLGQIVMYHNLGVEIKFGKPKDKPTLADSSPTELKSKREELRRLYGKIGDN